MSDAFDVTGEVVIKFIADGLDGVATGIGELTDELVGGATPAIDKYTNQILKIAEAARVAAGGQGGLQDATQASTAAAQEGSAAWGAYVKQLNDANAAYRAFQRDTVTGEATTGAVDVSALSDAEMEQYLATYAAQNATVIGAIRERMSAEKAAVDSAVAGYEEQASAFTASYTDQLAVALRVDEQIAAAQNSARYATPALASRNTANPAEMGAAQDEYQAADLAAMSTASSFGTIGDAEEKAEASTSRFAQSLSTTRYALYDVSDAMAKWGAGLVAIPVLSALVASSYQRDFANVERATLDPIATADQLKQGLISLSEQIPVSFKDLTTIATAGAQLGVPSSGLIQFTSAVAELTAATTISASAAENMFQKFMILGGVSPDMFNNLASAILNVSIHTGATEAQISLLATRIIGVGKEAGFTVPQIIGLSAAFASISAQSASYELGTVTRFINDMQKAVESGGPALQAFASTAGVSAQTVQQAFGTDKFSGLFVDFIGGMKKIQDEGGNVTSVLNEIGITSVRDVPALENLANAHGTLVTAMKDAQAGWENEALLAEHFGKVQDTLKSQTVELGNTFMAFANQLGSASTGPLTFLEGTLENLLKLLTGIASTPLGGFALDGVAGLAALGGAALLVMAGIVRVVATVDAFKTGVGGLTTQIAAYNATAATTLAETDGIAAAAAASVAPIAAEAAATTELDAAQTASAASGGGLLTILRGVGILAAGMPALFAVAGAAAAAFTIAGFGGATTATASLFQMTTTADQFAKSINNGTLSASKLKETLSDTSGFLNDTAHNLTFGNGAGLQQSANYANAGNLDTAISKESADDLISSYTQLVAAGRAVGDSTQTIENEFPKATAAFDAAQKAAKGLSAAEEAQVAAGDGTARSFSLLNDNVAGGAKGVATLTTAFEKSEAPLTTMSGAIGQVQTKLEANATAAANAYNANLKAGESSKSATDFYNGSSVSIGQLTAQLNTNAATLKTWNQNLDTIAAEGYSALVTQFQADGPNAVSESLLAQVIKATPAQGKALETAQSGAINAAGTAAAQDLITAGHLMTASGKTIGASTAAAIGAAMQAGEPITEIVKQYGLKWDSQPAYKPKTLSFTESLDPNSVKVMEAQLKAQGGPLGGSHFTVIPELDPKGVAAMNTQLGKEKLGVQAIPNLTPKGLSDMRATVAKQTAANVVPTLVQSKLKEMRDALAEKQVTDVTPSLIPGRFTADLKTLLSPQVLKVTLGLTTTSSSLPVPNKWSGGFVGYASGGYTGDGGKYEPKGVVHGGEFVFSKAATSNIGVANLAYAHNMAKSGGSGYAEGGPVGSFATMGAGGGVITVALSGYDRQLLAAAGNLTVTIPGVAIQKAAAQGSISANTRGSN